MNILEIKKEILKNKLLIGFFIIFGGIVGFIAIYLPKKYVVEGTFYVTRKADMPSNAFFTYEGSYAQQTASSFTNTFEALIESPDMKKNYLEAHSSNTDSLSIKKLSKKMNVKKTSPQSILLSIKDYNKTKAEAIFTTIEKLSIAKAKEINKKGDAYVNVSRVSQFPLITYTQHASSYYIVFGALSGLVFGITLSLVPLVFDTKVKGKK